MSDLLIRSTADPNSVEESARRAVSVFRSMQPTLSTYAQMLTGREDIEVVCATADNGSTDGTRIFFRPPIELGDNTPHVRYMCDRRDDSGLQICRACRVREEVMVTILHEIAHICFDSFETVKAADKRRAIEWSIKETRGQYADRITERIKSAPNWKTADYINLVSLINEYLPYLLNCLEDARVNGQLFLARRGLRKIFESDTAKIFNEGFETADGKGGTKIVSWKEAPLNSQVMIGVFCKASGYDYSKWFHPKVVEALNDSELTDLVEQMEGIRTVSAVYNLSFKVLARLRDLGYCGTPQDSDPEPEPETPDNAEPNGSDSPPDDPNNSDDSSDSGDSSADLDPSGDGSDPSDSSDSGDSQPSEGEVDEGDQVPGDEAAPEGDESSDGRPDGDSDKGDPDPEGVGSDPDPAGGTDKPSSGEPDDSEIRPNRGQAGSDPDAPPSDDVSDDESPVSAERLDSDNVDPVDTGADDGYGGTEVLGDEPDPEPEMGTPDDLEPILKKWMNHEEKPKSIAAREAEEAVDKAIIQGLYFTTPSREVWGVREHYYGQPIMDGAENRSRGWNHHGDSRRTGTKADLVVSEAILQPALMRLRRVFTDNQRGKHDQNRKSGRINANVLGKRAPFSDPRLFMKNTLPGKRDYLVIIAMDISGSTVGVNIALMKRAVFAQCELLDRLGIPFILYAHTGDRKTGGKGLSLDMYHIKDANEPWNKTTQERLEKIGAAAYNLDGHALEFLRKEADKHKATDKIIMYYSDGKMPAENKPEELVILRREIQVCKRKNYHLMGVGIRTDSPRAHGLDTVEVHSDNDLEKVVKHLEKELSVRN